MMMYDEVLSKINSRLNFGVRPGLSRIKKLLSLLGNPQGKLKFIHVAGTNGKGSVCNMLSLILSNASYKTGLFTSPYVVDFRERFQINNEMISKKELIELFEEIEPFLTKLEKNNEYITEFELITSMAFLWFFKKKCEVVVLEVGLGGRLDATNVISKSIFSIITSISLDHVNILGDTLEKIAIEKSGIIKKNGNLVLYHQDKIIENTIKKVALEKHCKVLLAHLNDFQILDESIFGTRFIYKNKEYFLSLCGRHQIRNASVVFKVIENLKDFSVSYDNIKFAFKNIKFAARFDIVSKKPMIIIDGAHNPDSINKLKNTIKRFFYKKRIIGLCAMLKDKDVKKSLSSMLPLFSELVVTEIDNPRSLKKNEIFDISKMYCKKVFEEKNSKLALEKAYSLCEQDSIILIFGSLYLASEIYNILKKELNF